MPEIETYSIPGFTEPVNCFSHLFAAGVFAVLGVLLVRKGRGNRYRVISLCVFAASSVLILSLSGVYHLLAMGGGGRAVLQRLDHAGIFMLIAGTFTPIHTILFKGAWRWGVIVFVWTAAITGITLKTVFFAGIPEWLGLVFYLGFGWMGAISAGMIWRKHGFKFVSPLLWGALSYTAGAALDILRVPVLIPGVIGAHELFHFCVIAGIAFHLSFIHTFAHGDPLTMQKAESE
jgi:channel protein (hemolysin III family)